jgi:hypothetical protein
MKNKKAIQWQKISEGIITETEILNLQNNRQPVSLVLTNVNPIEPKQTSLIQIVAIRGPAYNVISDDGTKFNKKPYQYLSCAVRRAVKKYKEALYTHKWKIATKV